MPTPRRVTLAGTAPLIARAARPLDAFAALDGDASDAYDLCFWLTIAADRYPRGVVAADTRTLHLQLCIEASRKDGAWSLRVSPWNGSLEGDDALTGSPLVELRDQTSAPDPLTLLRALLSGAVA